MNETLEERVDARSTKELLDAQRKPLSPSLGSWRR